tara:strand:- start:172 stop:540 length:369 start_codon:yes stop_codon:yes gene_type:complete
MDDKVIRDIIHIVGHLVVSSLIFWQVVLGVWLILKWINKNWKIKKTFSVMSPTENKQPIINIDGSSINEGVSKNKKDKGVVDVDYKKNIFISDVDNKSVKLDEKIKGKVKTQKDKLKKLKGK